MKKTAQGFTLVELLVVMAIVGILAAVASIFTKISCTTVKIVGKIFYNYI